MRSLSRLVLFGLAVGLSYAINTSAADEPAPLLKNAIPISGHIRVRFPVTPGYPKTMQFSAQVPNGQKKSELVPVTVAYDSLLNKSYIAAKKLESWGYEVPANKEFVLPELHIATTQVSPKLAKERDLIFRLTNVKLTIIEKPVDANDTIFDCDLCLSSAAIYGGSERLMEPRLSFANKFLEFNVPSSKVKRPGTDDVELREVTTTADANLVPAFAPMVLRGTHTFAYAAVNEQDAFKVANGTVVPVKAVVASINNWQQGILISIGLARGCNVQIDQNAKAITGTNVDSKSEMIPAKLKELRLGLFTDAGYKTPKDLVLKDVPVVVDMNISEGGMSIGQSFIDKHFKDAVYSGTGDGYKLYGRVNSEMLVDVKTRKKSDPKP